MTLYRIALQPARNPGAPASEESPSYTVLAPLTPEGKLDFDAWQADTKACRVVRYHPDPSEKADGWLTRRGTRWVFHYDEEEEGEAETAHRFGEHILREGEYITVDFHGETPITYKITDVSPV